MAFRTNSDFCGDFFVKNSFGSHALPWHCKKMPACVHLLGESKLGCVSRLGNVRRSRKYLKSILNSTNESLRWTWQIVMGFALISAVTTLFDATISGSIEVKLAAGSAWMSLASGKVLCSTGHLS
jgi:hypothetical protein